ncbi:hypothetical protein [Chamaesiphon sp.]|uniref:hypothetical protein n=1 Tax=Chamaesiphon sp. TaxID=2814140 RepID=UPI0035947785
MFSTSVIKAGLRSGLKIYGGDPPMAIDRLRINDGAIEVNPDLYPQYSHPAFIPKLPWRPLTDAETEIMTAHIDPDNVSQTIGIVKFPESVIDRLQNLIKWGATEYGNSVTSSQIIAHAEYDSARAQIEEYIFQSYAIDRDFDCLGLIRCDLDLPTTTINGIEFLPEKLFAGLHLDSWDYRPFRLRHLARNRICINLGREVRYFLLINRTLQQIFEDLNLVDPDDIYRDYRGVRLSLKFLRALADYPVIRLAVHPGEAYIAPTENFIHDATSIGKTEPDWSITFLGRFSIPN